MADAHAGRPRYPIPAVMALVTIGILPWVANWLMLALMLSHLPSVLDTHANLPSVVEGNPPPSPPVSASAGMPASLCMVPSTADRAGMLFTLSATKAFTCCINTSTFKSLSIL